MEDIRKYRIEEEDCRADDERAELSASADEDVPFHIPRD